jgi:hypothetical protein
MTTKKGPEALDVSALDAVTGGTGLRNTLAGHDGKTPTDDQPGDPPPITTDPWFSSGGGGSGSEEGNDSIHGEISDEFNDVPGPSDLLNPNTPPGLVANGPANVPGDHGQRGQQGNGAGLPPGS